MKIIYLQIPNWKQQAAQDMILGKSMSVEGFFYSNLICRYVSNRNSLLSPQGTVKTIDYLIRKEILSRNTERLVFCVPILKEWIVAHEGLTV